jgi:hypothetical protein
MHQQWAQRQSHRLSEAVRTKDHKDSLSQVRPSLEKHCRRCRFAGRVRTSMLLGGLVLVFSK